MIMVMMMMMVMIWRNIFYGDDDVCVMISGDDDSEKQTIKEGYWLIRLKASLNLP
jgi:hypothetical protein